MQTYVLQAEREGKDGLWLLQQASFQRQLVEKQLSVVKKQQAGLTSSLTGHEEIWLTHTL